MSTTASFTASTKTNNVFHGEVRQMDEKVSTRKIDKYDETDFFNCNPITMSADEMGEKLQHLQMNLEIGKEDLSRVRGKMDAAYKRYSDELHNSIVKKLGKSIEEIELINMEIQRLEKKFKNFEKVVKLLEMKNAFKSDQLNNLLRWISFKNDYEESKSSGSSFERNEPAQVEDHGSGFETRNGQCSSSEFGRRQDLKRSGDPTEEKAKIRRRQRLLVRPNPVHQEIRCAFCTGQHYSDPCSTHPNVEERRKIVEERDICHICLRQKRAHHQCFNIKHCIYCESLDHHSSLCLLPKNVYKQ